MTYNILIILLLFISLTVMICNLNNIIECNENKTKIYALSFAADPSNKDINNKDNYKTAKERFSKELKNTNFFNDVFVLDDTYLKNQPEFWSKHSIFIENNTRGYGYWIWKPFIILKTLENMI